EFSTCLEFRRVLFRSLFLCTHNSARSVLAECVMNRLGKGRFHGWSAGSMPSGRVHPMALDLLKSLNYDISGLRSKSWEEFAAPRTEEGRRGEEWRCPA